MASLQNSLSRALAIMAQGSQSDPQTVMAAVPPLAGVGRRQGSDDEDGEQILKSLCTLRDLLHVAGWLYPCFMPSSTLPESVQDAAANACMACLSRSSNALLCYKPSDCSGLMLLGEPRIRPRVPGALAWVGDMAAQVTSATVVQWLGRRPRNILRLVELWHLLAGHKRGMTCPRQYALMAMQPGILQLLRLLTSVAIMPGPVGGLLLDLLDLACYPLIPLCGIVLHIDWEQQLQQWAAGAVAREARTVVTMYIISGTRSDGSPIFSSTPYPSVEQVAAVTQAQAFWWRGVATWAEGLRTDTEPDSTSTTASATTTASSSSSSRSSSSAAALCPNYHQGLYWPACALRTGPIELSDAGARCVEVLLLQEAAGALPWALQQLHPYAVVHLGQLEDISDSRNARRPSAGVHWPLLPLLNPITSSGGGHDSCSTSSCSSKEWFTCRCQATTCYLCSPPAPVTLQRLRLVLEVVCLTATETSEHTRQAQLLLALLLQRAQPQLRAAFLSSADGVRLLVALQQGRGSTGQHPGSLEVPNAWHLDRRFGALSSLGKCQGGGPIIDDTMACPAQGMVADTLAWCFLQVDTAAAALAAAAAPPSAAAAGGLYEVTPAGVPWVTPAAVAEGSLLALHTFRLHLLDLAPASLRLVAGVVPNLALFATLEQLLRGSGWDDIIPVLTTLVAAVQALLASDGHGSCEGCGHGVLQGPLAGDPAFQIAATNTSSTTHNSNTSSSGSTPAACLLPGVLEAVASVAVTASKVLRRMTPPEGPGRQPLSRPQLNVQAQAVVLTARLSNAVLQLALQQQQQQQQQQQGSCQQRSHRPPSQQQRQSDSRSLAVVHLMTSAQHLLYGVVPAALTVLQPSTAQDMAVPAPARAAAAAGCSLVAEEQLEISRDLCRLLHTGWQRLQALQQAAAAAGGMPYTTSNLQPAATSAVAAAKASAAAGAGGVATAGGPATTPAPPAAAAGGGGSRGACGLSPPAGSPTWCPAHTTSMTPAALLYDQQASVPQAAQGVLALWESMCAARPRMLLLPGCCYVDCTNNSGPSEAGLVAGRRRVMCSGCRLVRYCSTACAQAAWPDHRKACCKLAAATGVGMQAAGGCSSGSTASIPLAGAAAAAAAAAAGGQVPAKAVVEAGAALSSRGNGSSGSDETTARDQGAVSPASHRVCAWCGVASQQLLRCGRCKAAWYCGTDHQRAAWKAGHKKECGTAAGAV